MMTQQAIDAAKAFDAEHGDFVCHAEWLYFEDGAKREKSPMGIQIGTPFEEHERLKRVVWYWKLKLKLAVAAFDHAKHGMVATAKGNAAFGLDRQPKLFIQYGPTNTEASVAELKKLKDVANKIFKKHAEAQNAVQNTIPEEAVERPETDQKCRAEWNNYVNALSKIEI